MVSRWTRVTKKNAWGVLQAFKSFLEFRVNHDLASIFLKWNHFYPERLRRRFELVNSTFELHLDASADWSYIAPEWLEKSSMQQFVWEVPETFPTTSTC